MLTPTTGWKLWEHKKQSEMPNQGWTHNLSFWLSWKPYFFFIKLLSLLLRKTRVIGYFLSAGLCRSIRSISPKTPPYLSLATVERAQDTPILLRASLSSSHSAAQLMIPIWKHSPDKMSIFVENKHRTMRVISYNRDDEEAHLSQRVLLFPPHPPLPTFTLNQPPIKL